MQEEKKHKGTTYHLGNAEKKGVLTVRQGGVEMDVMMLHDHLEVCGMTKHHFEKQHLSKMTNICGRGRYQKFVCLTDLDGVPKYFTDKNGVFECLIDTIWRKVQMVTQYKEQQRLKSRAHVQAKLYAGSDGLEHGIFHRLNHQQNISLVILPIK